jgi:hypothetical protein
MTSADEQPSDDGRIIEGLGPRATELLLFLAVHPGGAGRDYLVATLWPDAYKAAAHHRLRPHGRT